jgi:malate synthase
MPDIHNVFHVSQVKKCLRLTEEQISVGTMDLQDDLRYEEVPMKISDTVITKQTRTSTVRLNHVRWSRHTAEAT